MEFLLEQQDPASDKLQYLKIFQVASELFGIGVVGLLKSVGSSRLINKERREFQVASFGMGAT